jgi:molecular chaperone GrpE
MDENLKKDTEEKEEEIVSHASDTKEKEEEIVSQASDAKEKEELSIEDKLKETEEKLLRSLAEIENQRRRFEKEIKEAFEYGGFNFSKECILILDNLQRAKISIKNDESLKENKDLNKYLNYLEILETDMVSIFEKNNIKKIGTKNKKFDPNLHQAMLEIEDDTIESGTITQEIQAGYMFGERLLRPSYVGVAKKKNHNNKEKEEKKTN